MAARGRVGKHNEVSVMTYANASAAKESRVINSRLQFKMSDLLCLIAIIIIIIILSLFAFFLHPVTKHGVNLSPEHVVLL